MRLFSRSWANVAILGGVVLSTASLAQNVVHGRKYKPPPQTTQIIVNVEKAFNGKPLSSAAVIFHSTKDGKDNGNLELKTDPDGRASLDLIETGSHVTLQVFAKGFATHAEEFDLAETPKEILVKLERPRAQVSTYSDTGGKPAEVKPGVQEHVKGTNPASPPPVTTPPAATSPGKPQ
jgi:hypothetical protein